MKKNRTNEPLAYLLLAGHAIQVRLEGTSYATSKLLIKRGKLIQVLMSVKLVTKKGYRSDLILQIFV